MFIGIIPMFHKAKTYPKPKTAKIAYFAQKYPEKWFRLGT